MIEKKYKCRVCKKKIKDFFCDLGSTPLANSFLKNKNYIKKEKNHPLKVYYCKKCYLPQLPEHIKAENIFSTYDYFSSYSKTWIEHSKNFVNKFLKKYNLDKSKKICEIASNDGYLLQFFKNKGYDVLGIEPATNVADAAIKKKIPTLKLFFGQKTAKKIKKIFGLQDLIICNNVYAHVPDILDFTKGLKELISTEGIITIEFPHFLNLIKKKQFDTIYHEHFSYLSLHSTNKILQKFDFVIFKVEKISTHGGSLRIYIKNKMSKKIKIDKSFKSIFDQEKKSNIFKKVTMQKFSSKLEKTKKDFINLLINLKIEKKKVAAYGAAAKGNTFLNYCNIGSSLIDFVVDKNPSKVGKLLPGSHLKIFSANKLKKFKPDYLVILPWNIKGEIIKQIKNIGLKTKFITAIPKIIIDK
jgi:2-polyprenyl-3-methyl-5-hydroxy-6-metoxy-1,4-benzoquinol methylase